LKCTCGRIGGPNGVNDCHGQVETQNGVEDLGVPDLHGPIRTGGDEGPGMEVVPSDFVDGEQVSLVGLLVLSGIGLAALVNSA